MHTKTLCSLKYSGGEHVQEYRDCTPQAPAGNLSTEVVEFSNRVGGTETWLPRVVSGFGMSD